ncbi:DUF1499 domain-containing protein [Legionella sp. W05-934-2]|jgi:uncharacterized protein (DUF1499 family)|uniref:DUF1499 domain-containing protein n=1 Tax=Legionella sp. W05-934-2 TaxID=1198649 RepID=UPI0034633644
MDVKIVIGLIVFVGVVTLICYLWPQINFKEMPKGLCAGNLNGKKPNWVSSKVDKADSHYVAPLKITSLLTVEDAIKNHLPGITIYQRDKNNLLAYRQSPIYHFTDWICIEADGSVTSSATLGYGDFNQNRKLVESIRQILQQ